MLDSEHQRFVEQYTSVQVYHPDSYLDELSTDQYSQPLILASPFDKTF